MDYINVKFRHIQNACFQAAKVLQLHSTVDHPYLRVAEKSKYYGSRIFEVLHRDYEQHQVVLITLLRCLFDDGVKEGLCSLFVCNFVRFLILFILAAAWP